MIESFEIHSDEPSETADSRDTSSHLQIEEQIDANPAEEDVVFGYPLFLEKIKDPSCQDFVSKIQLFCSRFPPDLSRETASRKFLVFFDKAEKRLFELAAFSSLPASSHAQATACLEKYILKPLSQLLYEIEPSDAVSDKQLADKIDTMISADIKLDLHLKGPSGLEPSLVSLAVEELKKISSYRAPKDKLQCLLNAHRVIRHNLEISSPGVWSADDLLPVIIFCVLRSRPGKLKSDVSFIRAFTDRKRLSGEVDYIFTCFEWASAFIQDFDLRALCKLSDSQRVLLQKISCAFTPSEDMPISNMPAFLAECELMNDLVMSFDSTGFDFEIPLNKISALFDWYKQNVQFVVKMKQT